MLPYWRLSAYYCVYFGFIGAFSPYFSLYLQSIGQSAADIAILMSLMQVMRVLAPNLWGWLAARLGWPVRIIQCSGFASLLGFLLFFVADDFTGLFIAMAVMAFFWSAALPLIESVTFAYLGQQVQRYSSIRMWGSIGFIFIVLGIGYGLEFLPLSSVLVMNALVLAGIVVTSLMIPNLAQPSSPRVMGDLRAVLRRSEVKTLLAACFLMSAAHGAFYVFFSLHLVDNGGYSKAVVGWMWTLGVVAEILVFMAMPWLSQRYSLHAILAFSFVAAVVRFLVTGWQVGNPWWLAFAQTLHGATFGAYHASAITLVNRWFSGVLQASGQALYGSVSFGAGGLLGSLLSGVAWDYWGADWTYTISAAMAALGLICIIKGWRQLAAR